MASNKNLFKFEGPLCGAMGIRGLVLKEDEILPFLKEHQYITPYESKDRYVVSRFRNADRKMSTKLCDFFGLPHDSVLREISIIKYIFDYINEHNLRNPDNKNEFIPDEKLKELFSLREGVILNHSTINECIRKHLTRAIEEVHEVVYNGN